MSTARAAVTRARTRSTESEYRPPGSVRPGITPQASAPVPPLLTVLAITIFLPVETSLMLGGLRLPVARLLLLLFAPYFLTKLGRKMAAGRYRFVQSDLFVLLASLWMLVGSISVIGLADALNHAGPEILEFSFAYLATRTLLSERGQAVSLMKTLCTTIACVGFLAALDPLADRFVIHDFASSLTGFAKDVVGRPDYRLGMRRAAGVQEHPILLGATCMIGLLCTAVVRPKFKILTFSGAALGLLVSVSSAPIQAAIMGFGLLSYEKMFGWLRWKWLLLLAFLASLLALSFIVLGSPLGFVNQYLVFDAGSGFSRQFEWETVSKYIASSPWVGIGFGWDEIASQIGAFASIDSVWLGKALIYGIPCSVLIAATYLGSASLPTRGHGVNLTHMETRLGLVLGIIMCLLLFVGFTVYFWGSFWILASFIAGIRAHLGELGQQRSPVISSALRLGPGFSRPVPLLSRVDECRSV